MYKRFRRDVNILLRRYYNNCIFIFASTWCYGLHANYSVVLYRRPVYTRIENIYWHISSARRNLTVNEFAPESLQEHPPMSSYIFLNIEIIAEKMQWTETKYSRCYRDVYFFLFLYRIEQLTGMVDKKHYCSVNLKNRLTRRVASTRAEV